MWTKLVEIVQMRLRESGRPPRRLAKGAVALYGAMANCREAFLNFKKDHSETRFANFVFSIDGLISTLQNLNPTFEIFDPGLSRLLQDYAMSENRAAAITDPRALARSQIKLLRKVVNMEFEMMDFERERLGEFDDALDLLGAFIQSSFTVDDIFGSNERSTANTLRHGPSKVRERINGKFL